MKKKFLIFFIIINSSINLLGAVEHIPLKVKSGLWRHEIVENSAFEKILGNLPEEQKLMMKKVLQEKMKSFKVCQTAEMLKDPAGKFKEAIAKNPKIKNCNFKLLQSRKDFHHSKIVCSDKNWNTEVIVEVINEKEQKQTVITSLPVPGTKVVVKANYVGDCKK